jgi:hypothetical protein
VGALPQGIGQGLECVNVPVLDDFCECLCSLPAGVHGEHV